MRLHLWGEEVANVAVEHKVSLILTNVQYLGQRMREIFRYVYKCRLFKF